MAQTNRLDRRLLLSILKSQNCVYPTRGLQQTIVLTRSFTSTCTHRIPAGASPQDETNIDTDTESQNQRSSVEPPRAKLNEPDWIPLVDTQRTDNDTRKAKSIRSKTWSKERSGSRLSRKLPSLSDVVVDRERTRKVQELTRKSKPSRDEDWKVQKDALQKKFQGVIWNPKKKLSPDAMEGIRGLHMQDPVKFSTPVLAEQFKISPEAIRRILKSKWRPSPEQMEERRERWARRHDRIWDQQAELGLRPWRKKEKATEDPDQFDKDMARKEALGEISLS